MGDVLTPDNVQKALDTLLPGTTIRFFEATTATSQQAADQIGCLLGQIVKSICFVIGDRPVIVLTSGDQKVDDRKLADLHGVGRKQVRAASAHQCIDLLGYPPGSVPPLAHRSPVTTWIDKSLERFDQLYAAGGAHNAIFPITLSALVSATGGQMAEVVKDQTLTDSA